MPVTQDVKVKKLSLDKNNFRTVKQADEASAIHALIAIDPEWYWALTESLIENGYLPTENIIVLKDGRLHTVREGNRRISALKLILGLVDRKAFGVPRELLEKIDALSDEWLEENSTVPCTIYGRGEEDVVDRVVSLTHGKGEKAGRADWKAIARARHNRDVWGVAEPALDLLEKYLVRGKNHSAAQAERWAGDYPLSVLDEVMKRLATRLGQKTGPALAKAYPKLASKAVIDEILLDIGLKVIGFKEVRADSFGTKYGLAPVPAPAPAPTPASPGAPAGGASGSPAAPGSTGSAAPVNPGSQSSPAPATPSPGAQPATQPPKGKAHPVGDPKSVAALLKRFKPRGSGRSKLSTLLSEIRALDIEVTPHAFCFVLRSMFEISAKAYCDDHAASGGPRATKSNGDDRALVDVLRDVVAHLTNSNADRAKARKLQGAIIELATPNSVLSVTSLNQLIHNPSYVVTGSHVCTTFANVFPLLEEMNK